MGTGAALVSLGKVPIVTAPPGSLHGSLSDVGIDDVLRLLAAGAHSGLMVVNPANPQWLILAGGTAVLGGSATPMALGRALLTSGSVESHQVEGLIEIVGGRIGDRVAPNHDEAEVLEMLGGVVAQTSLYPAVREQVVATVFEMMLLGDAEMHFTGTDPHRLGAQFSFPVDAIVSEAAEQARRWPEVRARVGDDATRLRRVRRLTANQGPVVLDALEWAALSELEDRSTIGQVVHRLGIGRFSTYRVLDDLLSRSAIEPG